MTTSTHLTRVKRAEFLSSLGAGVLGAGLALLWSSQLARISGTEIYCNNLLPRRNLFASIQ